MKTTPGPECSITFTVGGEPSATFAAQWGALALVQVRLNALAAWLMWAPKGNSVCDKS